MRTVKSLSVSEMVLKECSAKVVNNDANDEKAAASFCVSENLDLASCFRFTG